MYDTNTMDITNSMITIVNIAVWYTWKLLREYILKVLITRTKTRFFFPFFVCLYEIMNVN